MPFNLNLAIQLAQLVQSAYNPAEPLANFDINNVGFTLISTISANNLSTDINILFPTQRVQIGYVISEPRLATVFAQKEYSAFADVAGAAN
jgi:hypothetical protein